MGPWLGGHGNRKSKNSCQSSEKASMGPWLGGHGNRQIMQIRRFCIFKLQWGRGWGATETPRRGGGDGGKRLRFNGAVAGGPRKRPERRTWHLLVARLQWGRGWGATETPHTLGGKADVGRASMGPWLGGHGNHSHRSTRPRTPQRFNGAVAGGPRKHSGFQVRSRRWCLRFNGAVAGGPRKPLHRKLLQQGTLEPSLRA